MEVFHCFFACLLLLLQMIFVYRVHIHMLLCYSFLSFLHGYYCFTIVDTCSLSVVLLTEIRPQLLNTNCAQ